MAFYPNLGGGSASGDGGGGGGGGSTPGLPVWTYSSSGISDGQFALDGDTPPNATTLIGISLNSKNGGSSFSTYFSGLYDAAAVCPMLQMISSTGEVLLFTVTSASSGGASAYLNVTSLATATAWSGDYQVSFLPSAVSLSALMTKAGITPITDGTYTLGIGVTQNGTETTQMGIITEVAQVA